mgnify:FL=1
MIVYHNIDRFHDSPKSPRYGLAHHFFQLTVLIVHIFLFTAAILVYIHETKNDSYLHNPHSPDSRCLLQLADFIACNFLHMAAILTSSHNCYHDSSIGMVINPQLQVISISCSTRCSELFNDNIKFGCSNIALNNKVG